MVRLQKCSKMKPLYRIALTTSLSLMSIILSAQSVNWLSWDDAMSKAQVEQRKIIIDIYTEWCTWCKKMEQTTFRDSVVVKYINDNYYAIKFDAQSKDPIVYQGKTYKFENGIWKGGYHQFAAAISNGQVKLPTVVFLDENASLLQALPGFRNALEMELMTAYFNGDHHKSTPWKTFVTAYQNEKKSKQGLEGTIRVQTHTRLVSQKNK